MRRILLQPLLVPGDVCHVAISSIDDARSSALHTHDFMELFVILDGAGWHLINGKRLSLKKGDVILIRARDCHGFRALPRQKMRLLNVAFLSSWFESFHALLPGNKAIARWMKTKMPPKVHLSGGAREALERRGDELILAKSPRHFGLARFCLEASGLLESPHLEEKDKAAPDWLVCCVAAMDKREHLANPIGYFQKMAGRSPEHFARVCRQHFGAPPTELLNQARIRQAKRRLLENDAKVIDIAHDCGFDNVGYFHRVFLRLSGLTPRYWRFKHRPLAFTS